MDTVLTETQENIAIVTINRPNALNALSREVLTDLEAAFTALEKNKEVLCVILTGAGEKSFVAGADIAEMKDMDKQASNAYADFANKLFLCIEHFQVPVIAAVNGYALGGGCELAMACDIRIAASHARFAQPETGLGITPGFGGTQRLPRLVGLGIAKELIYTCRQVKADEALSLGLVNKVVEAENLMQEAKAIEMQIAKNAPIAIRYAKNAINEGFHLPIEEAVGVEQKYFSDCFSTNDQKLAMTAFVNKEKDIKFTNK